MTVGVIMRRMASEHGAVSERPIRGWLAEDAERGRAERASHLTCRTPKPRDAG